MHVVGRVTHIEINKQNTGRSKLDDENESAESTINQKYQSSLKIQARIRQYKIRV